MAVRGVRGALHPAAGGRLQPHVSRAFPLQQRHRRTQTQRLRRCFHRAVRYESSLIKQMWMPTFLFAGISFVHSGIIYIKNTRIHSVMLQEAPAEPTEPAADL